MYAWKLTDFNTENRSRGRFGQIPDQKLYFGVDLQNKPLNVRSNFQETVTSPGRFLID